MKTSMRYMKSLFGSLGIVLLLAPLTVLAQTKVVVIPLGDDAKPLMNIITVAKANGKFTDPVAAVNSITDASESNPYLVVIGPGVYTITQTLVMKQYVDIAGSGENITKLTGAISTDKPDVSSAIVSGVTNATLSSLTVENTGGSTFSFALYNNHASPTVRYVTAMASGGTSNMGVINLNSSATMKNVTAKGSGGDHNRGVNNIFSSSPTMTNVTAMASGGITNIGIYNGGASSPTITNVTAKGSGGTGDNYGVYNTNSASPLIRRSTMEGEVSLSTDSGITMVSQSTLIGFSGVYVGGTNKCVASDNGSGKALDANCQPTP